MRRVVDPASLVFLAALVGSLGVHLPVYEVLGVLAERLSLDDAQAVAARPRAPAASEVAFELDVAAPPGPEPSEVRDDPARPEPPPEEAAAAPPPPPPVATAPVEQRPRPEPEPAAAEHAVTQRSRDPSVAPPPDARFVAEENSSVAEETVARERSLDGDADQSEAAPADAANAGEDPGDREDVLAQSEDREGVEERAREPARVASATPPEPAGGEAGGAGAPSRAGGGERARYETITIRDGNGSFVIRRPVGEGPGRQGGVASLGPGGGGRASEPGRGRGAGRGAPNLNLGFSQLEQVVGADVLREERQAYTKQRRSRRRGTDHAERFRRFRAAIENFVPNVRPGNQTALNARASPFAAYTAEVHRRLHLPFHEFVAGVGARPELSNPSLETKLEIVLNRDGSVHQIGVVRTSGQLLFDHGAYAAVEAGAPYPVAPGAILSGDGRIYLRWTFKAAEPFCHPIHSERFILDNAPEAPGAAGDAVAQPAGGPQVGALPSSVRPQ